MGGQTDNLNNMCPAAKNCNLGTWLNTIVTLANELKSNIATVRTMANELKVDHNALLAKLDLDAGVTDTNYAALHATAAADVAAIAAAAVTALD